MREYLSGLRAGCLAAISTVLIVNPAQAGYSVPDGVPESFADKANFTLFETVPVRPLKISQDKDYLYALNTPDDRLEIFRITETGLELSSSVPVGMRPVALAESPEGDVWVVNFLSDSVSIVDPDLGHVEKTLLIGDEPRDIVFAGTDFSQAFITTAHRGQNSPIDPQTFTPSVGRADVWVFDSEDTGNSVGTKPKEILTFFADTPRALAATPDGATVYVATFNSGNQTTVIHEGATEDYPEENIAGEEQPHKSKIVKYIDGEWIDSVGRNVSEQINFNLPDYDVFTIDASGDMPVAINGDGAPVSGVGTTLFNMVVNPQNGKLYVSNTEANNLKRFEGPGLDPEYNTTNRGDFVRSRITVIHDGTAEPRHLNKHIDYSRCCDAPGNAEARRSLALPRQMVISDDGSQLYVAALGSSKVGVFNTGELENDSFIPDESQHISLTGGAPSGLALDEERNRLYVRTQFNNGIAVIDLASQAEVQTLAMHTPEPEEIIDGRRFLYDAFNTSSHGDSACAGCHVDGDMDHIAWDLGDPTAKTRDIPGSWLSRTGIAIFLPTNSTVNAIETCAIIPFNLLPCADEQSFHFNSLKGPMLTQTMAGMDNHGPMHWRGDRTGGKAWNAGSQPNDGMFDERTAFAGFNAAFPGLLGRSDVLEDSELEVFTDFALANTLPPNPHRNLDNSLTERQAKGKEIFFGGPDGNRLTDITRSCDGCHITDPKGNAEYGVERPGFFGSDGRYAFVFEPEMLKVPHLRTIYQRIGMFAMHDNHVQMEWEGKTYDMPHFFYPFSDPEFMGDQIRGFGFTKDGSIGQAGTHLTNGAFIDYGPVTLNLVNPGGFQPYVKPGTWPSDIEAYNQEGFRLYSYLTVTNLPYFSETDPDTGIPVGLQELRTVEDYLMVFPNNMAPVMGQQVTASKTSPQSDIDRIALFEQRAAVADAIPECDLVARHGRMGYLYHPETDLYLGSDLTERSRQSLLNDGLVTFTCMTPGDGLRAALDRDLDGYFDQRELAAGTDPSDPSDNPGEDGWWSRWWTWLLG